MDFSWITDPEQRAKAEADYKKNLEEAVAKEVEGLKGKNNELIEEKRRANETLAEYKSRIDGVDIDKAKEALALMEKTKRKDLLQEGKLDEYIAVEVQTKQREIEKQYSTQLEVTLAEKDKIAEIATKYEQLFKNKIIEDRLRDVAMKSGCKPHAEIITDIITRGKMVFALNPNEDGIEAKNFDGSFKKSMDGDKILTPEAWMDDLKRVCPYYFPESTGTGATGGSSSAKGGKDDLQERINKAVADGNMELFRELRKKQGAKLK